MLNFKEKDFFIIFFNLKINFFKYAFLNSIKSFNDFEKKYNIKINHIFLKNKLLRKIDTDYKSKIFYLGNNIKNIILTFLDFKFFNFLSNFKSKLINFNLYLINNKFFNKFKYILINFYKNKNDIINRFFLSLKFNFIRLYNFIKEYKLNLTKNVY